MLLRTAQLSRGRVGSIPSTQVRGLAKEKGGKPSGGGKGGKDGGQQAQQNQQQRRGGQQQQQQQRGPPKRPSADASSSSSSSSKFPSTPLPPPQMLPVDPRISVGKFLPIFQGHSASRILKDRFVPKQLRDQFVLLQQSTLLLRNSAKQILDEIPPEGPGIGKNFLIDGSLGSGKTSTLLQVINYCLSRKWFVFYVPSVRSFINGESSICKQQGTTSFAQPDASLTLTQQLQLLNPTWFENIKLKNDHRLGETFTAAGRKLITVNKGITLSKLAEIAAANSQQSSQALVVILEELAEQTEIPVLIAVDDANYLFGNTAFDDPDDTHPFKKKKLHASRFLLLEKLTKFLTKQANVQNGAVVGALTRTIDNPMALDGTLHYEHLLPEISKREIQTLQISNYSREEIRSCLEHYRVSGVLPKGPISDQEFHRLRLLTGGNGKELFKAVASFI